MKPSLLFNFTVNKENNTVLVEREFVAKKDLVWDAFTKAEILDQWWAPSPWVSKTKSMDFIVGGSRFYAMCGPNGEEHWSLMHFTSISPKNNFKFKDAFCDENRIVNNDFPQSEWNLDFEDLEDTTKVNITIKHKTLNDLEKIIEMGFKEGFTIALNGLNTLLNK
ncbi:SRPBCC domain-containing protein [Flagellimonas halotolerans]|uniref:SRPBCC domain-containing protein n=1 Tax=Flagellimonas halotolerans TaxID=3112164 RepID=A0ABU6IUQ2_9FLAO|nr:MULTISPECIES: SRPBCC domain-containing protein [unclassified Allomuricauda]MEC3966882.1 SRPBCC domain-containing protein [Muricauda sp. SYSU M86414]MEC4266712.1 SRPBCC domain-containing protein [Muricauda sp. SYSU M84420]